MKKFICGMVFGILLALAPFAYASGTLEMALFPVKLFVNGEEKVLPQEQAVFNHNGSAYVPLRFVSEALGAKVYYDGDGGAIAISAAPFGLLPKKYDLKTAERNGDILERNVNWERVMEFMGNVEQKKSDWLRVAVKTTEGDLTPRSVVYDGDRFHIFVDNTRDGYGDKTIISDTRKGIEPVKRDGRTDYVLTGCGALKPGAWIFSLKD